MIKNLNLTFLSLLLLNIFLSYCTPYSSSSSPVNLGPAIEKPSPGEPDPGEPDPGEPDPGEPDPGEPDPGEPDPGEPDPGEPDPGEPDPGEPDPGEPDPGEPDPEPEDPNPDPDSTTWKNISQIGGQSAIYKTLKGKSYYQATNKPEGASGDTLTQTVPALSDGSNYNMLELSYKILNNYFTLNIELAVAASVLPQIGLSNDKKVFIYIVDSSMGVVAQPSSTTTSYSRFANSSTKYSIGTNVQGFNDDFAKQYEGQELAALMVYKIGKETFYIKYPFKYTIVKEPTDPDPDPGEPDPDPEPEPEPEPDGEVVPSEWKEITQISGNSSIYKTLTSTGSYKASGSESGVYVTNKANSSGTGYDRGGSVKTYSNSSTFKYTITPAIAYSNLSKLKALVSTKVSAYLLDPNLRIVVKPNGSENFSLLTSTNQILSLGNLLALNTDLIKKYAGKDVYVLMVYEGTDGQTYYIKYPMNYTLFY